MLIKLIQTGMYRKGLSSYFFLSRVEMNPAFFLLISGKGAPIYHKQVCTYVHINDDK